MQVNGFKQNSRFAVEAHVSVVVVKVEHTEMLIIIYSDNYNFSDETWVFILI